GRPAIELLAEELPKLISRIKFTEMMRWNSTGISFSRPIRWIVALIGDAVIPFEYAGVVSGRVTRGARATGSQAISVRNATDYFDKMKAQGIVLKRQDRWKIIEDDIQKLAQEVAGTVLPNKELLYEVANLVEQPTALRGTFEKRFLELPRDVLITVMNK